jgi:hypothetical protein
MQFIGQVRGLVKTTDLYHCERCGHVVTDGGHLCQEIWVEASR